MLFLSKLSIVLFLFLGSFAAAQKTSSESSVLRRILDGYDNRVRPPIGTSTVKVQLFIRRISDVCSKDQELTVEFTFRQYYVDPRLDFRRDSALNYVTVTDPSLIWKPDLFFSNGEIRKTHDTMIRIFSDGTVLFSQRVTVRLSCPMSLSKYPFDQQKCKITIASYSYKKDDLELLWHEDNPVQVHKPLDLQNFVLKNVTLQDGQQKSTTGTYSYLDAGLILKRQTSYYFIQIYIPCAMLVILSWLSFWINVSNQLLKSLFALLSLITLALALTFLNQNLPMTNYTKAVDTWTGVCLTFIFAALIESVVVYYRTLKNTNSTADDGQLDKHVTTTENGLANNEFAKKYLHFVIDEKSDKVDCISRIAFPALFALFTIIYFLVCCC